MEERLNNLKKAMDRTAFSNLAFTENHQRDIREKIRRQEEKEEDILLAILQLLVSEKTGYELVKLLQGRGIRRFDDNEGSLYTILHRLEQKGCLQSIWDTREAKYYGITDKGRKLLQKSEKSRSKKQFALKELLEG